MVSWGGKDGAPKPPMRVFLVAVKGNSELRGSVGQDGEDVPGRGGSSRLGRRQMDFRMAHEATEAD